MAGCNHCAPIAAPRDGRFRRVLVIALVVNATMFVVEVIAGWLSGSLALQADALDFLGDSFNYALSLAVLGMGLAARARAAMLKGVCMALFGTWVLAVGVHRAVSGAVPDAGTMGAIGALALVANVAVAALLYRYREGDSNMRSVWLCSRNDAISNVAIIAAAGAVHLSQARWPDLAVACVIAALALHSSIDVLRRARDELAPVQSSSDGGPLQRSAR